MSESESPPRAEAPSREAAKVERARARAVKKEASSREKAQRREERRLSGVSHDRGGTKDELNVGGPGSEGAELSIADPKGLAERLGAFTDTQVTEIADRIGPVRFAPWPKIDGCLAILFSSRSGSTYLARDLERLFEIGRLREALRPPRVKGRAVASIVEPRRDAWFSFKAGGHSLIAAELCGFFDTYLDVTSFILLLRRDIVAQAVSGVKAKQTGQYHSTGRQPSTPRKLKGVATYDPDQIARYLSVVASSVQRLRLYAERTGRPWRTLLYEDFAQGDFTRPMAVCDAFGIPRRAAGARILSRSVERLGDATNEAWTERFREEMDAPTREIIERYVAEI